jgi:pilus assembly protein Flp/PilA
VIAIRKLSRKLCSDKRGATVIEYGLIAALIIIAIMVSMKSLGGGANGMWGKLSNKVEDATT